MLARTLARLKIGPKLLLAPGVVLLLLLLLSSAAYYAMVRQNQSLETIVGERAANLRAASEQVTRAQRAHARIYQLLSWYNGNISRARIEPLVSGLHRQHEAIRLGFERLAGMTRAGGAERRYVEQAAQAHRRYVQEVREVIELGQADQSIGANAMIKAEAAFGVVAQRLEALMRLEHGLAEQASEAAAADFRVTSYLMPVVVALAIGVSLAITVAVRRALLAEIRGIGAAAVDLASGDLTVKARAYGGDEIAQTSRALDDSIRNLNGTLRTILDSARSIDSTSRDIARMDGRARKDAALVQEAAAAARTLQLQALTLSRAVSTFRLDEAAGTEGEGKRKEEGGRKRRHPHLRLASSR